MESSKPSKTYIAEKVIPKLDISFAAATLIGLLMLLFNAPASQVVLMISLSGLAANNLAGLYFGPGKMTVESQSILQLSRKIGHLGISIGAIGILWSLLLWPNYNQVISLGILLTWAALGIRYWYRDPEIPVFKEYFMQKLVAVAFITLLLGISSPVPIYKIIHQDDPQMIKLIQQMDAHPEDPTKRDELQKYREEQKK